MIDMTIDHCRVCGYKESYIYRGADAQGDVFKFDVCDICEQKAMNMMTERERVESLYRWTWEDKR